MRPKLLFFRSIRSDRKDDTDPDPEQTLDALRQIGGSEWEVEAVVEHDVWRHLRQRTPDTLCLDMRYKDEECLALLAHTCHRIRRMYPSLTLIILCHAPEPHHLTWPENTTLLPHAGLFDGRITKIRPNYPAYA